MLRDDYALTPEEVKQALDAGEPLILLDVRTPAELQIARIEGALCIPMHEIEARLHELPEDRPIVCICHHGVRSDRVAHVLCRDGYDARNLMGGIDAWSVRVDANVPRY